MSEGGWNIRNYQISVKDKQPYHESSYLASSNIFKYLNTQPNVNSETHSPTQK